MLLILRGKYDVILLHLSRIQNIDTCRSSSALVLSKSEQQLEQQELITDNLNISCFSVSIYKQERELGELIVLRERLHSIQLNGKQATADWDQIRIAITTRKRRPVGCVLRTASVPQLVSAVARFAKGYRFEFCHWRSFSQHFSQAFPMLALVC